MWEGRLYTISTGSLILILTVFTIGVVRGPRASCPSKFLEHIVILCFKRQYPKQISVICLKSSIRPLTNFWDDFVTAIYFQDASLDILVHSLLLYVNRQSLVQFLITDLKKDKHNNKNKSRQISSYLKR